MEKWKTVFPVFQNGGLEKWKTKEPTSYAAIPANYTTLEKPVFLRWLENGFPAVFQDVGFGAKYNLRAREIQPETWTNPTSAF